MVCCCNCLRAFIDKPRELLQQSNKKPPVPPRCLLLGPTGSGKTTFFLRVKTGQFHEAVRTKGGSTVEELLVAHRTSLLISDFPGATLRRHIRLHFLPTVPLTTLAILFFIDATSTPSQLNSALDDLSYAVHYTRSHTPGDALKFVGVVINKQDHLPAYAHGHHTYMGERLLAIAEEVGVSGAWEHSVELWEGVEHDHGGAETPEKRPRAEIVADISRRVNGVMEQVMGCKAGIGAEDAEEGKVEKERTEPLPAPQGKRRQKRKAAEKQQKNIRWQILDGGPKGVSGLTGHGVKSVFDTLTEALLGVTSMPDGSVVPRLKAGEVAVGVAAAAA